MRKQLSLAALFVVAIFTTSAHAVTVERTRLVIEETTIQQLFVSFVRGLGYQLGESPEGSDLSGFKEAVGRLKLEPESMTITLTDREGREQTFAVEETAESYQFKITVPTADFNLITVQHVSQQSYFWTTVRGYRLHFKQELEYNSGGFVRFDLRVINAVDRLTGVRFYFDLYEKNVGERTRIETSLAVTACVPGRPCGIIHRIARRTIAGKSDEALITLDCKVREIVRKDRGNWLELVPILADRAVAGVR